MTLNTTFFELDLETFYEMSEEIEPEVEVQAEKKEVTLVDVEEVDEELEEMKKRVAALEELEAESEKLREMQESLGGSLPGSPATGHRAPPSDPEKEELDSRSVYVGSVDYKATPEELQKHFQACGTVNRVTIMVDKFTGRPKGFAYIEFVDKEAVDNAVLLNESTFKGRELKVSPKRTNIPGMGRRPRRRWMRPRRRRTYSPY